MKTIKTLFVMLFLSSMFFACEADNINEEVGLENEIETVGEDGHEDVQPD